MENIIGLTKEEVEKKVKEGQVNVTHVKSGKSYLQIFVSNIFTYFNVIFVLLAALVCAVGSYKNASFVLVVVANTLIGIFQEVKSKITLDKLNLLNAPKSKVIRDGKDVEINSTALVLGDYIRFVSGNQIPADCEVVSGRVSVNESLLTGEQDEISKDIGANLMSGSFIVSGECVAITTAVGDNSYISKLTIASKKNNKKEISEMVKSVDAIIKVAGIVIIPVGILLFYQSYVIQGVDIAKSVTSMVAALIGMIPEGLYLLLTVALATGAVRLAQSNVLLHEMKSMETLARVDVFCVDKTGTITEPTMNVKELIPLEDLGGLSITELEKFLRLYANTSTDNNSTMVALKSYFEKETGNAYDLKVKKIIPFSSKYKLGAIIFEKQTLIFGAPEFVLKEKLSMYNEKIIDFVNRGYRVLAFATQSSEFSLETYSEDRKALGFIVLENKIRENAKQTFKYFKEQGVAIKVISGDNPKTVAEVAKVAGIENTDKFVDAATLDTEEKIYEAAKTYTVFGRVTPEQKKALISALRKQGHYVAMTGDGVNDILAMKKANCSIAMASGSEAAAQSAQLVLLDSDFGHMPAVVAEGRRVVNNIKRSATLFLVKNIFSLTLSLITLLFAFSYPLNPSHIMLISIFTIGLPGMLIAFEPNNTRISGSFIRHVLITSIPAGITNALIVATATISGNTFSLSTNYLATALIIIVAVVGFMILRKILLPFTTYRIVAYIISIAGMILVAMILPDMFDLKELEWITIVFVIVFSFASESVLRVITSIVNNINARLLLKAKNKENGIV